jgi:excisionase family DNA binding protein
VPTKIAHNSNTLAFAPSDLLTPSELAERLKVPQSWVYEMMRPSRKTSLPVLRAGRHLRFSWTAVCAWMAIQPPVRRHRGCRRAR